MLVRISIPLTMVKGWPLYVRQTYIWIFEQYTTLIGKIALGECVEIFRYELDYSNQEQNFFLDYFFREKFALGEAKVVYGEVTPQLPSRQTRLGRQEPS